MSCSSKSFGSVPGSGAQSQFGDFASVRATSLTVCGQVEFPTYDAAYNRVVLEANFGPLSGTELVAAGSNGTTVNNWGSTAFQAGQGLIHQSIYFNYEDPVTLVASPNGSYTIPNTALGEGVYSIDARAHGVSSVATGTRDMMIVLVRDGVANVIQRTSATQPADLSIPVTLHVSDSVHLLPQDIIEINVFANITGGATFTLLEDEYSHFVVKKETITLANLV